ncbi:putative RNA polymerase II subunit B1 CTD phosphatase RPAP2 [Callorhinchus milii]|uniref:RNA polymerase II subunit B1 CTD phosphatase RPAP2 homolog n=1 Tax=Callorhinchus milii TaxID=7868 RepID=A0A4W3I518_CALMI|nr:putative RNA polymerase II subunit B1 CTD phosphatase RPAP2 [Callorhinchus milii]|eukprot:gi/632940491/ref/XP_007885346.1/ PREDICTED: putative RNA polymerase II subunit B1 CTD phosphatase RPAP2 isoform X1 [Callorhinchus milii]
MAVSPSAGCEDGACKMSDEAALRRATLEVALRRKHDCEKKALLIVERLLEMNVTEDFLRDCATFITPLHYQDVVEERSIIKQCGYPVCQNNLVNVPKQQYTISTKTNRVYDITERKNFCSNFCYKASKYYEAQISKSPLWLQEERPTVCHLLKGQSGSAGQEINFENSNLQVSDIANSSIVEERPVHERSPGENSSSDSEQEFLSTILLRERYKSKTSEHKLHKKTQGKARKTERNDPMAKHKEKDHTVGKVTEQLKKCQINNAEEPDTRLSQSTQNTQLASMPEESTSPMSSQKVMGKDQATVAPGNFTTQGLSKKGAASLKMLIAKSKYPSSGRHTYKVDRSVKTDILDLLRQALTEWNTEETLIFLYGSNFKCKTLESNESSQVTCVSKQELDEDDLDNLEAIEIGDPNQNSKNDNSLRQCPPSQGSATNVGPLPDMERLKPESECLHLKIREFYKGRYVLSEDIDGNTEEHLESINYKHRKENPVLPLVDSNAQHQIRRRIVVEKLKKALPDILGPLRLTMCDISPELNRLVKTFRLTNTNILHRPSQWTLIAIVLLAVLSVKIPLLQETLQSVTSEMFISTFLQEFDAQIEDLENLKNIFKYHEKNGVGGL